MKDQLMFTEAGFSIPCATHPGGNVPRVIDDPTREIPVHSAVALWNAGQGQGANESLNLAFDFDALAVSDDAQQSIRHQEARNGLSG